MVARFAVFFSGIFVFFVSLAAMAGEQVSGGGETSSPRGPNLLADGGLEQVGQDGLPVGFAKYVYGAQPKISFDNAAVHEGRQSLRIQADQPSDTALGIDLKVKPGAIYCFSGWVRTANLSPEPRSWTHGTFQIQDAPGRAIARLKNHPGTTDWCEEKAYFRAPSDGKIRVSCFFVGFGMGTGTVWFDDLRLTEVPMSSGIVVTATPLQRDSICPMIYGNFVELLSDLVPSMRAEKLDVTSFEYLRPEERSLRRSHFAFDPKYDPKDRLWTEVGNPSHAQWLLDPDRPFNGQVSQRIRLLPGGENAGISQGGIFVDKGEKYRFTGHFRQQELAGPVRVELTAGGRTIASATISDIGTDWSRRQVILTPTETATNASFVLRIATPGAVWVDRVSLMPEKNVHGWRPDVVKAIREMRPGVVRWGGSIIEGYSWKDGIGPWEKRVPFANRYWGRVDPNFVGIDEFLAFCRAVEAEPLVCLRWSGQKPSEAAELVEYCNGPTTNPMGSLRAKNGHPEAYRVKFWQIGNEVGGDAYDASFADFARAMRKSDRSIQIFASFASENLLKNAGDLIDFICPHHYDCANIEGTEAGIQDYAEMLRRFAPGQPIKLAVTEWNTTAGGWPEGRRRLWTLQNALACARYLNLCHRYADLIKIACRSNISNSYCSGIIQTNNQAVYGAPAYHVSKLYAERAGSRPLTLGTPTGLLPLDVSANLSADGATLSLIAVNSEREPISQTIDLTAFRQVDSTAKVWTIADVDDARNPEVANSFARPDHISTRAREIHDAGRKFSYRFPAYSVTLIQILLK